jgi:hypothetical protein
MFVAVTSTAPVSVTVAPEWVKILFVASESEDTVKGPFAISVLVVILTVVAAIGPVVVTMLLVILTSKYPPD